MSFEMLSFEMSFEMSAGRASVSVRTYTSHMNTVPSLLTCFRSRADGHAFVESCATVCFSA